MRKNSLSIVVLVLALVTTLLVAAEDDGKTIRLVCTYSYTINDKGEKSDTTGEKLFTVTSIKNGKAVVSKQGLGAPFLGTISAEEIAGEATYDAGNLKLTESLSINRFTGDFRLSFGVVGKSSIIHFGSCRAATKQLF